MKVQSLTKWAKNIWVNEYFLCCCCCFVEIAIDNGLTIRQLCWIVNACCELLSASPLNEGVFFLEDKRKGACEKVPQMRERECVKTIKLKSSQIAQGSAVCQNRNDEIEKNIFARKKMKSALARWSSDFLASASRKRQTKVSIFSFFRFVFLLRLSFCLFLCLLVRLFSGAD
jgi:hypothetical protein